MIDTDSSSGFTSNFDLDDRVIKINNCGFSDNIKIAVMMV